MNQALFDDNQKWAIHLAWQYLRRSSLQTGGMVTNQISQAALIGLWQAANKYKGDGNFKTYAYMRVIGAVKDELRSSGFFGRAGNKNGIAYGPWVSIDGWSEAVTEYIRANENE